MGLADHSASRCQCRRPEFWEKQWALCVQSEVDWWLGKTERVSRYRQCGQDMKELLEKSS